MNDRKESRTKRYAIELIVVQPSAKICKLRMMSVRVRPQSFEELLELNRKSARGREERGERREERGERKEKKRSE